MLQASDCGLRTAAMLRNYSGDNTGIMANSLCFTNYHLCIHPEASLCCLLTLNKYLHPSCRTALEGSRKISPTPPPPTQDAGGRKRQGRFLR